MPKVTDEQRENFKRKVSIYRDMISQITVKEKNILEEIQKTQKEVGKKKIELTEDMVYSATLYLLINNFSLAVLETRNEDCLNEARKSLYRAVIYMEEVVSNYVDVAFSEYEQRLVEIAYLSIDERYYFVRKLGLAIQLTIDAYGSNTKWKWSFVELQGRFAVVAKNMLDLVQGSKDYFDGNSPAHDTTVFYFRLLKKLFPPIVDGYRDRFEFSTHSTEDLRFAATYAFAYRRILVALSETTEAEEFNKMGHFFSEKIDSEKKRTTAE